LESEMRWAEDEEDNGERKGERSITNSVCDHDQPIEFGFWVQMVCVNRAFSRLKHKAGNLCGQNGDNKVKKQNK